MKDSKDYEKINLKDILKDNFHFSTNLNEGKELPFEETKVVFENEQIRIEQITSYGNCNSEMLYGKDFWYNQEEDETVMLLSGSATLEYEYYLQPLEIKQKETIPRNVRHRVYRTDPKKPTTWLCVFYK